MFAKVLLASALVALVLGEPAAKAEPALTVSAPAVAYAAAPVLSRAVVAPLSANLVTPVATSSSSQYFSRIYNGVATYAVEAPVAQVVDTRARFVAAAPNQVVVSATPAQVFVNPAQFVATPTATSSQFVSRTFNGLPTVTYYTVPAVAAAPVAVGIPAAPAAAPVPSAPVAPPTQSSTDVEVLDA